ncbi:hypothetical protein [Tateyamaria omphalii]|uniref:hypothetical protein n=1 Tax=Tateyamaria omphalii TaxID=299262 RepID=UPI0016799B6B|nr:hypothetical protein [Tateyamaria omphalii]
MRLSALLFALMCAISVPPAKGQHSEWPDLDQLLFSTLTASGTAEASFWLPDQADPAAATRALGIVYEHIPGSAGNTSIAVGLFQRTTAGWGFVGPVENVFGHLPSDATFGPTHVELTTIMPGPDDPRCCPTLPVRWRISLASRTVQRLN